MLIAIIVLLAITILLLLVNLVVLLGVKRQQPDIAGTLSAQRQELTLSLKSFGDIQTQRLDTLTAQTAQQLEAMRITVDEKLQTSLERRLNDSFRQVSERLEAVYKGLGEMQTLAAGVGDLKKVLTNVKVRGTWGEVQLGNLLDQFLAASEYDTNVVTRQNSRERVEFAIRLPAKAHDREFIWLPIDAKFPLEDYNRLLDAQQASNQQAATTARKELIARVRRQAKDIHDKYLDPPHTTNFAILYLPLEGLYAEVTQTPGVTDALQRDYQVAVMGPNTICAYLNSLQLGFRTLTIEKRSSEVWQLLDQIRTEFDKFGQLLAQTQKKLQEASNYIGKAQSKSTTITRKLSKVETRQLED